jgi:6-phosphogluconolactonase
MNVYCFDDKRDCCEALAAKISSVSRQVLKCQHSFSLVLSGGSTPRYLYRLLASPQWQKKIDWQRTHIFFGDERCVPPEHPDSNYGMAREALLQFLPTPEYQIHRIHGESSAGAEAVRYQAVIEAYFRKLAPEEPLFGLILLGLGSDGHTASLFPGDPALLHPGLVTPVAAPASIGPAVKRVSLTPTGAAMTKNSCFLVDGAAKTKIVSAVIENHTTQYPAAMVQGDTSNWFLSGMDCSRFEK